MGRLLDATTDYRRPPLRIEPHTFRALLLLLYGAGVRVGEARRLTLGDVDLPAALLTIRDTKFYKTRLVPLGADLTRAMKHYADRRQTDVSPHHEGAAFFVDRHGASLRASMLRRAFAQLRHCAGVVRQDGARYQPRLHDIRHYSGIRIIPSRLLKVGGARVGCRIGLGIITDCSRRPGPRRPGGIDSTAAARGWSWPSPSPSA